MKMQSAIVDAWGSSMRKAFLHVSSLFCCGTALPSNHAPVGKKNPDVVFVFFCRLTPIAVGRLTAPNLRCVVLVTDVKVFVEVFLRLGLM